MIPACASGENHGGVSVRSDNPGGSVLPAATAHVSDPNNCAHTWPMLYVPRSLGGGVGDCADPVSTHARDRTRPMMNVLSHRELLRTVFGVIGQLRRMRPQGLRAITRDRGSMGGDGYGEKHSRSRARPARTRSWRRRRSNHDMPSDVVARCISVLW